MNVAVLGTGIMGGGAVQSLLRNRIHTTVWNRSPDKARSLVDAGASWADSPAAAVTDADVVFSFLADDSASRAVWLGDNGVLQAMKAGAIAVESGTMSVSWIKRLGFEALRHGVRFFDAPVTGSKIAAANGQLVLLMGGDLEDIDRARPALEAISSEQIHFGPIGAGSIYKLINNMLAASHLAALGEGLELARRAGLNMETVAQAIPSGPAASRIVMMKLQNAIQHTHDDVHFALRLMLKDVDYALVLGRDLGINMDIIARTQTQFAKAAAMGLADKDVGAVVEVVK
jgi:3-hydroxyisobutyrate dehydrogenase